MDGECTVTVMFMYLIGPVFALGLILWIKRAKIGGWLRRDRRADTETESDP